MTETATANKLICTGYKTHARKRLATYRLLDDGGFFITGASGVGHWSPDQSGTRMFEFPCKTCRRRMRFSGEHLVEFLRAPGASSKDLSVLERILT